LNAFKERSTLDLNAFSQGEPMSERGSETRDRLVDTALRLFREDGYQATTMRRIATEAGVSLGNAYYYFAGKDELVHELYLTVQREHRALARPRLRRGATLTENLRVALHAGIDVMAPYQEFGSSFLTVALPPSSRNSPFSADSTDARQQAISLMREVVTSSRGRPSGTLLDRLPTLLWLAYLGITLHWVTDSSPEQTRTRQLIDGVTPIISRLVGLARLPVGRRLVTDVGRVMDLVSAPAERAPVTR
jgi:AcrR family transcriptional regulator